MLLVSTIEDDKCAEKLYTEWKTVPESLLIVAVLV